MHELILFVIVLGFLSAIFYRNLLPVEDNRWLWTKLTLLSLGVTALGLLVGNLLFAGMFAVFAVIFFVALIYNVVAVSLRH